MNNFVGSTLQNKFYAYCYILFSCTRRCTLICGSVWQFPSKEEEQHMFRTTPQEHW